MSFLPYVIAAWLFVVGLWGVVSSTNLIRTVISLTEDSASDCSACTSRLRKTCSN